MGMIIYIGIFLERFPSRRVCLIGSYRVTFVTICQDPWVKCSRYLELVDLLEPVDVPHYIFLGDILFKSKLIDFTEGYRLLELAKLFMVQSEVVYVTNLLPLEVPFEKVRECVGE